MSIFVSDLTRSFSRVCSCRKHSAFVFPCLLLPQTFCVRFHVSALAANLVRSFSRVCSCRKPYAFVFTCLLLPQTSRIRFHVSALAANLTRSFSRVRSCRKPYAFVFPCPHIAGRVHFSFFLRFSVLFDGFRRFSAAKLCLFRTVFRPHFPRS